MAQSLLELIFKTSKSGQGGKQAAAELKEVKGVVGEVSSGLLGFNAASLTAAGAIVAVGKFALDSTKRFLDYGEQIRSLTAITGTSAEETSRLMQAFDDMGVSAEQFATLAQGAAKKGFVMTLENVANLADEVNALSTQEEKNALLTQKMGRSAMVAAKAFEEGGQAIRDYSAAVSDGQALTEAEMRQADELRRNLDALGDSWDSLALTVGGNVATAINDSISYYEKWNLVQQETGQNLMFMDKAARDAAVAQWELARSLEWVNDQGGSAMNIIRDYGMASEDTAGQVEDLSEAQDELTLVMKAYNDQLLFTMASENLDAEAKMRLAESMGLVDQKTQFAAAKTAEWKQMLQDGKMSVEEYERRVAGLANQLNRIQSKDVTITTRFIEQHYYNRIGEAGPGQVVGTAVPKANATPGWVTVPPGYPNDSYPVMMSSGESYKVENDRQRWTGESGGGGPSIQIGTVNISGEMDYQTFKARLLADLRHAR